VQQKSFTHQPALDGVRAVAVLMVLLFHAGLPFVPAGYLGVSVFFTLSGYLITSLLVAEHASTGRVDLGAFWSRRLRRLLPASLVCVVAVVVARQFGAFERVDGLRSDIGGAVLQVFNWVKLAGSGTYGDLFSGATSPLEHYWSLAIEEQFYWIWPLVLWGLLAISKGRSWSITALVAALTAGMSAVAVGIAISAGPDAAYWSTPARLPEILMGATLACWLSSRRSPVIRTAWLAPAALIAIIVLSCVWPSGSGPAYQGALPAFALLSAALILGLQSPSRLRSLLGTRPLVWIGQISYGLYLFHWPVFVLLRERGWTLTSPVPLAAALAITFAIAWLSYAIVERRVRSAQWRFAVTVRRAAAATLVALVATQLVGPSTSLIQADDQLLEAAAIQPATSLVPLRPVDNTSTTTTTTTTTAVVQSMGATTTSTSTPPTTTTTFPIAVPLGQAPPRPVRMVVAGDSTALYVGQGLAAWSLQHPEMAQVGVSWCQGCTFMLDPTITTFDIPDLVENSRDTVQNRLPEMIRVTQPDVVVLMVTVNDVANRQWSADEGPLTPFDPRYVQRMNAAYADLTYRLLGMGVPKVVWVVPPRPEHLWLEPEMNEMARYPVQHQVIRDVVAAFDSRVSVVDLDRWLTASGHDRDQWWRNDGVHLNDDSATALADQYLGPLLVQRALAP
jgi:peptidoglycan/LPS O-acetylase OafA/YrhL/lysophospholipase L1-like esterase